MWEKRDKAGRDWAWGLDPRVASAHQLHIHAKSFIFGTLSPPHFLPCCSSSWLTCRQVSDEPYLVIDMTSEKEGGGEDGAPAGLCNWIARRMHSPNFRHTSSPLLIEGFCRWQNSSNPTISIDFWELVTKTQRKNQGICESLNSIWRLTWELKAEFRSHVMGIIWKVFTFFLLWEMEVLVFKINIYTK